MRKQWILVANGSLARVFSRSGVGAPLMALETIDFPEGCVTGNELGREAHAGTLGKGVHTFAHELAQRLEEGVVDGEYETFWLIASSSLLSDIKVCLNQGVAYRLKWAHHADFTGLDAGTLERRLRELWEPRELGTPCPLTP